VNDQIGRVARRSDLAGFKVKRPFKWLLCWNGKRQLMADL